MWFPQPLSDILASVLQKIPDTVPLIHCITLYGIRLRQSKFSLANGRRGVTDPKCLPHTTCTHIHPECEEQRSGTQNLGACAFECSCYLEPERSLRRKINSGILERRKPIAFALAPKRFFSIFVKAAVTHRPLVESPRYRDCVIDLTELSPSARARFATQRTSRSRCN
jgi:hypothetical protein